MTATITIPVSALRPVRQALAPEAQAAIEGVLADWMLQTEGPLLGQLIELLTAQLHEQAAGWSNEQVSAQIRLIAHLDQRREEAELAADPARRAGIERVGEHFARKAQLGFTGRLLDDATPA